MRRIPLRTGNKPALMTGGLQGMCVGSKEWVGK